MTASALTPKHPLNIHIHFGTRRLKGDSPNWEPDPGDAGVVVDFAITPGAEAFSCSLFLGTSFMGIPWPLHPVLRRLGFRTQSEIDYERYTLKAMRGDFRNVAGGNGVGGDAPHPWSISNAMEAVTS